mmetsp:Transcript_17159/g.43904  ORF Transcript_17159/g.43904 Transcript_17159/m.43904 type:complete len:200 (-) Transcript_17159:286-885(-)
MPARTRGPRSGAELAGACRGGRKRTGGFRVGFLGVYGNSGRGRRSQLVSAWPENVQVHRMELYVVLHGHAPLHPARRGVSRAGSQRVLHRACLWCSRASKKSKLAELKQPHVTRIGRVRPWSFGLPTLASERLSATFRIKLRSALVVAVARVWQGAVGTRGSLDLELWIGGLGRAVLLQKGWVDCGVACAFLFAVRRLF